MTSFTPSELELLQQVVIAAISQRLQVLDGPSVALSHPVDTPDWLQREWQRGRTKMRDEVNALKPLSVKLAVLLQKAGG
jgi:hypothetical protein